MVVVMLVMVTLVGVTLVGLRHVGRLRLIRRLRLVGLEYLVAAKTS